MKLARWNYRDRGPQATFGVVRDDRTLVDLGKRFEGRLAGVTDILTPEALAAVTRAAEETGASDGKLADVQLLPPVGRPGKIICVGVNYPERNAEYKDGTEAPKYPSLFVRFPASFVGHGAPILRPLESVQFDYEGEIVLVIGKSGRRIAEAHALDHVFGLTLMNEGSVRDWLRHGKFNVTQGKNFDRSGAIGPWIVPRSEIADPTDLTVVTRVNGEERQRGNTATLMFPFARIISYISTFTTLEPGDLIATGTPPGAGARFDPPRWLKQGDEVEVECAGIGMLRNIVEDEHVAS
jgi:2-keto-4-pentenoate hydratase/2-oxohepta-3-ene-1,7-dioic acid hydratase in catechol pathway